MIAAILNFLSNLLAFLRERLQFQQADAARRQVILQDQLNAQKARNDIMADAAGKRDTGGVPDDDPFLRD